MMSRKKCLFCLLGKLRTTPSPHLKTLRRDSMMFTNKRCLLPCWTNFLQLRAQIIKPPRKSIMWTEKCFLFVCKLPATLSQKLKSSPDVNDVDKKAIFFVHVQITRNSEPKVNIFLGDQVMSTQHVLFFFVCKWSQTRNQNEKYSSEIEWCCQKIAF